jgi:hypothetical protein
MLDPDGDFDGVGLDLKAIKDGSTAKEFTIKNL